MLKKMALSANMCVTDGIVNGATKVPKSVLRYKLDKGLLRSGIVNFLILCPRIPK